MKIHPLSDLHIEFYPYDDAIPDCDVVILAGDIGVDSSTIDIFKEKTNKPVLQILGNHDIWNSSFPDVVDDYQNRADGSNVFFMNNRVVHINDVRFIGATLWTDYNLYNNQPISMMLAREYMNDFVYIFTDGRLLTPDDVLAEHRKSLDFIKNELAKPFDGKTVVVSHHGPSIKSVSERFAHNQMNPCYVSDLEYLMFDYSVDLWIHGHVHNSNDYLINGTRVVSNPRGYCRMSGVPENKNFDNKLIIEI